MVEKLWVDDLRDPEKHVDGDWTWAKTSSEAFDYLKTNRFEIISLDNDLGESVEGIHIFDWIEERLYWKDIDLDKLKTILIHSSNVEAVRRMLSARQNMKEKYGIEVAVIRSNMVK